MIFIKYLPEIIMTISSITYFGFIGHQYYKYNKSKIPEHIRRGIIK